MLKNKRFQFVFMVLGISVFSLWMGFKISFILAGDSPESTKETIKKSTKSHYAIHKKLSLDSNIVKKILDESFLSDSEKSHDEEWPKSFEYNNERYQFVYSFDEHLTSFIKKELLKYKSDFSSVVVVDNNTGKILSAVGHVRGANTFRKSLAFSSTHPAASLIKIITSADLLESGAIDKTTSFNFTGRGTTLYRYQLDETKKKRWSRNLTLEQAFAQSNNVIFGKAALGYSSGEQLFYQASKFGFNKNLMQEISLSKSIFVMPKDDYHLAELASGMNQDTLLGPVHAAVISSIIVNDGVLKQPYIVSEIRNQSGENVWSNKRSNEWPIEIKDEKIIEKDTALILREMMELTVVKGTARGSFRKLSKKNREELSIGGKTGSLTGGVPYGRRDWFTGYAIPKNQNLGRGISISVMNINQKKWYVKAPYLARTIIEYYYKNIEILNSNLSLTTKAEDLKKI